jgi:hypothetical protein
MNRDTLFTLGADRNPHEFIHKSRQTRDFVAEILLFSVGGILNKQTYLDTALSIQIDNNTARHLGNIYLYFHIPALHNLRSSMVKRLVRSAFVEASHRMGNQNLLSRAPPCFGSHVKLLSRLHLHSLTPTPVPRRVDFRQAAGREK